jgi:hypothetical protein
MHTFYRNSLVIAVATLGLSACGGGGGSPGTPAANATAASSIRGVAADGYLLGATACLDTNDNKKCDSGEPQAATGAGGNFTINNVNATDSSKHGVVVEVNSSTIDEDTGAPVGKNYTLTAPPGKPGFVSPVTTLIHTKMEMDGSTADDAEKLVKQDMGFTQDDSIDLFKDYVKNSKDANQPRKADFDKIHKIAKIAAAIMGKNKDKIEQAALAANKDPSAFAAEIVNLVAQKVINQLRHIDKVAIAKTDDSEFTEDDLKDLDTHVDTRKIGDDLEKEREHRTLPGQPVANIDFSKLMMSEGGITSFRAKHNCSSATTCTVNFIAENLQLNQDGTLNKSQSVFNNTTSTWDSSTVTPHSSLILTSNGLVLNQDTSNTFSITGSTATELLPGGLKKEHQFIKAADLTGLPVNYFLGDSRVNRDDIDSHNLNSPSAVFSSGAQAFKLATKYLDDIYESPLDNDKGFCANTAITYVDSTTNCNSVKVISPTAAATTATTLADIMVATNTDPKAISVRRLLIQIVGDTAATSGTAYIYKNEYESLTRPSGKPMAMTTWNKKTLNGVDMIAVNITADVEDEHNFGNFPTEIFFFVKDGFVRYGALIPKGTFSLDRGFMFNSVGAQDIKDHFVPTPTH